MLSWQYRNTAINRCLFVACLVVVVKGSVFCLMRLLVFSGAVIKIGSRDARDWSRPKEDIRNYNNVIWDADLH